MNKKRLLFIVDDNEINRAILKNMLENDYDIIEAENGKEAVDLMTAEHRRISAVLLDLGMPVMNGYEVLAYMQGVEELKQIPVIVTTGQTDNESEEKALRLGAKDYVTKPYNLAIISQRILNTIVLRETSAAVNALQRDSLTGLYSRNAFFDKVREALVLHESGYYTMASFDVSKFKVINDQYGNEKGDEVLKYIARVFSDGFEAYDGFCCRIAADDFAVFYPTSFQNTEEIVEIRRKAATAPGIAFPIVFSIGRYIVTDMTLSPSAMYDRAILAANSIKGRYDAQIAIFDETMRHDLIEEQQIVIEMSSALEEKQFEIWYQPQYNHSTGALVGAEALVRWRHPKKGMLAPSVFIPIFEKNGFIYQLDKYVWDGVCQYLRGELDAERAPLPVSVNISRYDVFKPDFFDYITGLVAKYGLTADLLRLEITESAFSENTMLIVSVVKKLIASGFTLEIDDFGSGYSSLNTLKSVPAQVVKLDMRFFEGDDDSERGGNIIESVVRMTKWLGMSVIAEGVEEKVQADYLQSVGCNYIQGYLYSKPIPEADYRALCGSAGKEEKLLALETVENLDNNAFWNPKSMDTLIFNSYVGAACIFEYTDGRIELLRVSPKYAQQLFGARISIDDALKLDWAAHLEPEGRESLRESLEKSIETHSDVSIELVMLNMPNCPEKTHLRFNLRVIATAGHRCLVYCFYENITDQREAERRSRIVTGQLQTVLDNIACGITAVNLVGKTATYLLANGKYYDIIGYTKEQYDAEIGGHSFRLIHSDDLKRVSDIVKSVMKTGNMRTVDYRVKRRDGATIWLRSNISMAVFEGIDAKIQISTYIDITAQKTAELELLRTSKQMQTMMNDIPGGFARIAVCADGSLKPEYMNEGLCRLTGMTNKEMMSLYKNDAYAGVHPDDVKVLTDSITEMLNGGEARSARYRLKHKSGGYVWLSIFGRSTVDSSSNIHLNIYYADATEKVKDEERQKELLDNLSYGVALYEVDGTKLSVKHINKRYWELVNRKESEYTDQAFINAIYADDRQVVFNEIMLAIKEKRDASCDIRILYGENEYRPFHIAGRIIARNDGTYVIYATYTPITDEAMSIQELLPVALGAVMGSQSDYTFVKNKSLRYVCCSMPIVRLTGRSNESELIGKTDCELFDKELADAFCRDDMHILETGESLIDNIDRIPSADGGDRYACTSKYPLRDAHGNIVGVYGVGRDVTEERSAKSRFELLANSIPGGIATYIYENGKIHIVYCNDGFCDLFEVTREEFFENSAENPMRGIFAEYLPELESQLEEMVRNNVPVDCVYRVRLKKGTVKWINLKASVSDRSEDKVTFNAVILDTTQRQKSIEKMRISEEENRLAIQHTSNTVCRYDVKNSTLRVPDKVKDRYILPDIMSDIPESQVKAGLIAPDTVESYVGFYKSIKNGKKSGSAIYKRLSIKGWRWIEGHFSTIFSADGKPVSAVVSFRDVTAQIEKDTAYRRWKHSLSAKDSNSYSLYRYNITEGKYIGESEGALITFLEKPAEYSFREYTDRYIAQRVLPDDENRVCAFLNTETLLARYFKGEHKMSVEYREQSDGCGCRWLRLTVDMVDLPGSTDIEAYLLFENIDESKKNELSTIKKAETDPLTGVLNRSTFALRVNQIIRDSAPNTNHAFLMLDMDGFKKVNDAFGHAVGDRAIVDIANAIRSVVRQTDLIGRLGGDEFLLFIPDIPGDVAAATMAQQLCAVTRKSFSVEVELTCCVGIAVAPRDGSDFETLYQKADSALYYVKGTGKNNYAFYLDDMQDSHLTYDDRSTTSQPHKKRRMLIVDDSMIDCAMLSNMFAGEFIIEKARDGSAALAGLKHYASAISVVLLDLMMPKMDGFEVLKRMREDAELQGIPVIVVSGDENRGTSLRAIREGAVDFVSKPVDPDILHIRVQSAISRAENDRLRAQNSLLEFQNSEIMRYKTALESSGTFVVEGDWVAGTFIYDKTISEHIAGRYDNRGFWHILLSDFVADTGTVQKMQNTVHAVATDRVKISERMFVQLKTPDNIKHWFRLNIQKVPNSSGLTGKIYLIFTDCGSALPID